MLYFVVASRGKGQWSKVMFSDSDPFTACFFQIEFTHKKKKDVFSNQFLLSSDITAASRLPLSRICWDFL